VPCTLCGGERCNCISSVLGAIHQPDLPEPEEALSARLRPPPAAVPEARPGAGPTPPPWPSPVPPPPTAGGGWGPWDNPTPWAALPWRGGAAGVRTGWNARYDLLAAEHAITLVPAGLSLERLLFYVGLLLGFITAAVGAAVGAAIDRGQGAERLRQLLATPPDRVLAGGGVRVVAREQLESAQVGVSRGSGTVTLRFRDGDRMVLRWTRQPHVPALLQGSFGGMVAVGPRPLWQRALRVLGAVAAVALLLGMLALAAVVVVDSADTAAPPAARPGGGQVDAVERPAHQACRLAAEAFAAPPERFGFELSNAEQAMEGAASIDAGYQPAADALRWFRDRAVNGTISATEDEAAPHFDTLDRACAAHLANDEEPSSTF